MSHFIEFLKYLVLGLVQGITEPLPISSSGHMIIVDSIFGKIISEDAMNNFQIIVNFASLIAIVIYYRVVLKELIVGSFNFVLKGKKEDKKFFIYVLLIILASVPAGIIGLIIKLNNIDRYFSNILCVGITLFITGNLLLYIHNVTEQANRTEVTWKDSLLMGFGQVIGLLPGISRSGVTTSFGVSNKLSLESALRFSFMMYIPASFGAAILGVYDLLKDGSFSNSGLISGYVGAFIASLIGTYFAIHLFFKLVKNKNLKYFSYYCILISIIVLALIVFGVFTW